MAAVLGMAGDHMEANNLRQEDMVVDALRNVMTFTDRDLYHDHDPPFVLDHILLDHGLPRRDEAVLAQTRTTADAVVQVTAVMATAVEAAVQPEVGAETVTSTQ